MRCPYCRHEGSRVVDTSHDTRGGVRRRRECESCGQRFSTYERPILATPLVIKQDGTREEFDRDKLIRGIRISCAKRPVPAADIDRLVGEIEAALQAMGRAEVSSTGGGGSGYRRSERPGSDSLHPLCHCLSSVRPSRGYSG